MGDFMKYGGREIYFPTQAYTEGLEGEIDVLQTETANFDFQNSVKDKDLTVPPVSPTEGDRYIVAAGATGAWSTHDTEIAEYNGTAWGFIVPNAGYACEVEDEGKYYIFTDPIWEIGLGTSFSDDFNATSDWTNSAGNYYINFAHLMNTLNPTVTIQEGGIEVDVDEVEIVDANHVKIWVPGTPDLRFAGSVSITKG